MWKSYLTAYPQSSNEFWDLTPKLYAMKMEAFRDRSDMDFNNLIEVAIANAVFSNAPKDLDINKFFRGNREQKKSEQQKNNELLVALANFSSSFK